MRCTALRRIVEPVRVKDILFLNPTMQPRMSTSYGAKARGFFVSPIMSFNGKMWQLRTVCLRGQHYVAPFIVNGGGVCARQPILSAAFVRVIGGEHSNCDRALAVESPLGDLTAFSEWDDTRSDEATVMHNLVGHGLADLLQKLEFASIMAIDTGLTTEKIRCHLLRAAKPDVYPCLVKNETALVREIEATVDAARRNNGDLRDVAFEDYAEKAGWLAMPLAA